MAVGKIVWLLLLSLCSCCLRQKILKGQMKRQSATYVKKVRKIRYERDQEIEKLYSTIVHSIRMPMSIALGYAELIRKGIVTDETEKEGYIQKICEQMIFLNDSMKSILDVNRQQFPANFHRKKKEMVDITALLDSMMPDMRYAASWKRLRLVYEPQLEAAFVNGDPMLLKRVFYILLENSMKYMKRSGTIRVVVIGKRRGGILVIWRDDGRGMEAAEIPFIFERGRQGSNRVKGSGMGLYLVKKILEAYGGSVWARSSPGRGMAVYILFPEPI